MKYCYVCCRSYLYIFRFYITDCIYEYFLPRSVFCEYSAVQKGGRDVLLILILETVITAIQNVVRTGWVVALGTDSRLGLCVCSIAMIGGLGTAALYGE